MPVGHQHGNRFGCGDILFPGVPGIEAAVNDIVAGSKHGIEGNNHITHPPAIQRRRGRGPINSIGAGKHAAEICAQVGGAVIHQQTFHIFIVQRRIGLGPAVATVVADVNALRRDVEVRYHPVIAHIGAGAGKQSASGGVDRQTGDHQPVQVKQLFPTVAAVDAAEYPQSAADLLFFIVECYHTGIKNAVHVEHGGQDFVVQRGRCPVPTIAAVVAEVNPAAEAVSIIVGGGIEGAVDPVDAFDGGFIQRRRGDAPGDPSIEGAEQAGIDHIYPAAGADMDAPVIIRINDNTGDLGVEFRAVDLPHPGGLGLRRLGEEVGAGENGQIYCTQYHQVANHIYLVMLFVLGEWMAHLGESRLAPTSVFPH